MAIYSLGIVIQTLESEIVSFIDAAPAYQPGSWLLRNAAAARTTGRPLPFADSAAPVDDQWLRQALGRSVPDPLSKLQWAPPPARSMFLMDGNVMLRCPLDIPRLVDTERVRQFNEAWWREIAAGSRRDQLSFNYVARAVGLRYVVFPISIRGQNGLFQRGEHLGPAL